MESAYNGNSDAVGVHPTPQHSSSASGPCFHTDEGWPVFSQWLIYFYQLEFKSFAKESPDFGGDGKGKSEDI